MDWPSAQIYVVLAVVVICSFFFFCLSVYGCVHCYKDRKDRGSIEVETQRFAHSRPLTPESRQVSRLETPERESFSGYRKSIENIYEEIDAY